MESLAGWASSAAPELRARLAAEGWVHVPDRGVDTGSALASVLTGLGLRPRAYGEGLSRRTAVGDGVYSATIGDPAEPLAFHAELAHTTDPPAILAFACARPAASGGETRIADGLAIPPALGARWTDWSGRSLAYLTARPAQGGPLSLGRSWPEVYGTTDRGAVEARLLADGLEWTWAADGSLCTRRVGPVGHTWADGRPLWYNHLLLWHVSALGARARDAFLDGLLRPSLPALLGAIGVALAVWLTAAATIGPEAVRDGRFVVAHDDDFAQAARISLEVAELPPARPLVVLLGTSATREAVSGAAPLAMAIARQSGGETPAVAALLAAAMTPLEMLLLADALPEGRTGVAVVEISERNLAVDAHEHGDVVRAPRLPIRSPRVEALADTLGLGEAPPATGNYLLDNTSFFLARPQAAGALVRRPPAVWQWHQIDRLVPPDEADWRRLDGRMAGWIDAPEAVMAQNAALYRALVETLRSRGLHVALLRAPRNPGFLQRVDADPKRAARRAAVEAGIDRLAATLDAPVWSIGAEVGLQPAEFKDYTHVGVPPARDRFSWRLATRIVEALR